MTFEIGDKVKVVTIADGFENEGYEIGDIFTVTGLFDDRKHGTIYTVENDDDTHEMYHYELAAADADDVETSFYEDVQKSVDDLAEGRFTMTTVTMPDMVQEPAHYARGGVEPIEYMEQILPGYDDSFVAFCVGNALKYLSRAPFKGTLLQDLKKARQYLNFAIDHIEKGKVK